MCFYEYVLLFIGTARNHQTNANMRNNYYAIREVVSNVAAQVYNAPQAGSHSRHRRCTDA